MENNIKVQKVRSKKLNSKVDLTAMVSVSFLLIIFFMVNNEMSKSQYLELGMPNYNGDCFRGCYRPDENRSLTILLGDNDKMIIYTGNLLDPLQTPKIIKFNENRIRKVLLNQNKIVKQYSESIGKPKNEIIVIVKPSRKCVYKNLVDIIDELEITGITSYTIINEFTAEERNLLSLN
jgi:biopolymer transport protein ExbD